MFIHTSSEIPLLDPLHDNRHTLPNSEFARESLAFIIQVPEAGIGGFLYTWVNGAGLAGAAVCLFGKLIGEDPIFEVVDGIPVPSDMDFYHWTVGGLCLQLQKPLTSASITYQSDVVSIEYQFEATHQAYAYSSHANGCPSWMADDRFEQQGIISGAIALNNIRIPFNGLSLRDHSWGTRDWAVNQHWKWVHLQTPNNSGVHFWKLFALGREHLCGYVIRDGHMAQIVDVTESFSCAEGLVPKSIFASIIDSAGRTTEVCAEVYASYPFRVHDLITLFESPMTATINGVSGNGWMEMMWPNDLIGYMANRAV